MEPLSFCKKIKYGFGSLCFSILLIALTIPYSFFCIVCRPLPLHYRCRIITFWTGSILLLLKITCRINFEIEGDENIPRDGNGIIFSKHQSTWETFYLQNRFLNTAIILKRELLWVPFFGWGLWITDPIAINRQKKSSAMHQIFSLGKKYLEEGRWVLVFPEGTRIEYGKVGTYYSSGAKLAVQTGYPLLPVAHNAGYYWPKRGFIKRPGTIRVVFGPLLYPEGKKADELLQEAKAWIENTAAKMAREETRPR